MLYYCINRSSVPEAIQGTAFFITPKGEKMSIFSNVLNNLSPTKPLSIKKPVGDNLDNEQEDIKTIRVGLQSLGHISEKDDELDYKGHPLGYITERMDNDIKRFQKNNDLKIDGRINPEGETLVKINQLISKKAASSAKNKENSCEKLEIEYINASSAYRIALQNIEKTRQTLQEKKQRLNSLYAEKEKEKEKNDAKIAKTAGAVIGGTVGGVLASKAGAGSMMTGASYGISAGKNLGTVIEDSIDSLRGQRNNEFINQEINLVRNEISTSEQKLNEIMLKDLNEKSIKKRECFARLRSCELSNKE